MLVTLPWIQEVLGVAYGLLFMLNSCHIKLMEFLYSGQYFFLHLSVIFLTLYQGL